MAAFRWLVGGRVQGVGFRPFVYRLAQHYGLAGWVRNQAGRVEIFAQGDPAALEAFAVALRTDAPPLARPEILLYAPTSAGGSQSFSILPSDDSGPLHVHVPPDQFACDDCLAELHDPADRRYRYPFINCTQCGPRYTIIDRLPYDRPNTSMCGFELCARCRDEYEDPTDRRFHAQPLACPDCGPSLHFRLPGSTDTRGNEAALAACVEALRDGLIVAVKGVGGYHLMCDARNEQAVRCLRHSKARQDKPFAVMLPLRGANGRDEARRVTRLSDAEAALLHDPMRPIVLVDKHPDTDLAAGIAPGLDQVGLMLPYSPLHHLLLEDFAGPLVATSANLSGEPVLTNAADVEARLDDVADAFLHHNRPIRRPADDPVFRFIAGAARPLRLGRGCAPLELPLPFTLATPVLAVGAQLKTTVTLAWEDRAVVSPHIGDLGAPRTQAVFEQVIEDLQALYGVRAEHLLCDVHPDYSNTRWVRASGLPLTRVFHHHAHASALAGEFNLPQRILVFAWDGTGYGQDGTLWGGEALVGRAGAWLRAASLRPFALLGGDKAAGEPWRSAQAACWEAAVEWRGNPHDNSMLHHAWKRTINCPPTSAAGRLFDVAAALTGLVKMSSFEGHAPMWLEAAIDQPCEELAAALALPLEQDESGVWISDWAPLLPMLLDERLSVAQRAACFHASLAQTILDQALVVREERGIRQVGLTGGVFQNRVLTEQALKLLNKNGFNVLLPTRLPCNDAAISFGQVIEIGVHW